MSVTAFHRWFKDALGTTPHQWVINQRVLRSQQLLESSEATMEEIAQLSGFGTSANMRQHLKRSLGITPTAYRSSFATPLSTQQG